MPTFPAKSEYIERHIAFLTYDRVKLLDVTGPLQVFSDTLSSFDYL